MKQLRKTRTATGGATEAAKGTTTEAAGGTVSWVVTRTVPGAVTVELRALLAMVVLWATAWGVLAVPTAGAGEEEAWLGGMGTVQQWMALDARFYRTFDDNRWVDRSQFDLEQRSIYDGTFKYRHQLPAVTLQRFLELPAREQELRREAARDQLAYLERYFLRVNNQVQRLRENLASGWGDWVSDPTVLGDMLLKLRTACGLDPGNYHAWHLLSYFTTCAGDEERALEYLEVAAAALDRQAEPASPAIGCRLALDRAWLLRGRGRFAEAADAVDLAEKLAGSEAGSGAPGQTGSGASGLAAGAGRTDQDPVVEMKLLRGLIAAQTGRVQEAEAWADQLVRSEVRRFPNNYRTTDFLPEMLDPANWSIGTSSYLADWIRALALLREGRIELAHSAFGSFRMDDHYPFGWRFWNEAGFIYETTGRSAEAIRAWNTARINRPWLRNMVYKPYEIALGVLTGHKAKVPYMLGYDRFYIAGSRLAYAASLVGRVGNAETDQEKQQWAGRALEELEVCQRAGLYPGQALVLQGHVYYLLGDITSTLHKLEASLAQLELQGQLEIQQAVMKDMNAITRNQQASEMQSLFKQSGNSQGRWRAEADPLARIERLEADLEAAPESWQLRSELARALIRNGRPGDGRALVLQDEERAGSAAGLVLRLEADREQGDAALARELVRRLARGKATDLAEPGGSNAGLWSLVGSICLEQGFKAEAAQAFEQALALDPENQGVRMQLRMMGD